MTRPRVSSVEDPLVALQLTIPTSMKRQLESLKVNISALFRNYLTEYLAGGPYEETEVRKELEELEPRVIILKAKIEELETRKHTAASDDLERQKKQDRIYKKIAEEIKAAGASAYKMVSYIEQYPKELNQPLDVFKAGVEAKYPGLLERVYRRPEAKRARA